MSSWGKVFWIYAAGEHPCRSMISIKLICNFIEITLSHGYCHVNLLYIFRTPFPTNTSGDLILNKKNLFKINNEDTKTTSLRVIDVAVVPLLLLWTDFTNCSVLSTIDFVQLNSSCVFRVKRTLKKKLLYLA